MSLKNNSDFDPNNPKTIEELEELVRQTKKKLGVNQSQSANDQKSILELKNIVRSINNYGPQKIADKIEEYLNNKNNN